LWRLLEEIKHDTEPIDPYFHVEDLSQPSLQRKINDIGQEHGDKPLEMEEER
jgi:hypothetical protein